MAWCVLCELDTSMCAHSPAAQRLNERERRRARPKKTDRDIFGFGPTSSNRETNGEAAHASEFLREPQHQRFAERQIEMVYEGYGCHCPECEEAGRCYIDGSAPEIPELARYSHVALQWAARLVFHEGVEHDDRPSLKEWLLTLQELHMQERQVAACQEDTEHLLAERSKSAKPPERWLGRSPGYYSRGR